MKRLHPSQVGKTIGCIALAGCLLCASTVPAYAVAPLYGTIAVARTARAAEPGEYLYTQLNDNEKAVYDGIVDQIEELTRNDTDPSGVQVTIPKDSGYSISGKPVFAVFRDHPEFFWVDSSKLVWAEGNPSIDGDGNEVYVLSCKTPGESFFYDGFTTDNLQDYRDRLNDKVNEIKQNVPSTALDELATLKYLNDWMAQNNVYNAQGLGAGNFSRCAASGLLSDNNAATTGDDPVCYGYATAMKVLLDAFGMENAYIEGWAYNINNQPNGEQHAWNYVKLNDGTGQEQWYALDPTWDDPSVFTLPARQVYFLVGSNTVTEKNLPGFETFGKNHDSSTAKSPAYKEHKFTYPTLAFEARDPSASGDVMLDKGDGNPTAYDTLDTAMQNAESGDRVILQNSVQVDSTITLKDGVTLDLNGQTGGNVSSPCAITGTTAPVFRIEAGDSASIINSGRFTAVKLSGSETKVVENNGSLTLGGNVQFASSTQPMGGSSVIAGNTPLKAPHVRYVASGKIATAYLVAEPTAPAAGSFAAQDGNTVQDLLDRLPQPSVQIQYYVNNGSPTNVPAGEYSLSWKLKQSPNGGSAIEPTDLLENGIYHLETQAFDYTIPYEVEVSGLIAAPQEIASVSLSGLNTPVAGQPLDTAATVETAGVTASPVTWEPGGSGAAAYDTAYTAMLTLTAATDYAFASSVSVTINGQPAQVSAQPDGTLSVRMTFPATSSQPIQLQSIIPPAPITVPNGTALEGLPLPKQVDIKTSDGQTRKADVVWTRVPTDGTSYQPELATEQIFRLQGEVILPGGVEAGGIPLTVQIDVTVSAASSVPQTAAPTAQPAPGRYETNQTVVLTSATPDAVIYYTLDGSEPSATTGIRYTAPIVVNGIAGQSVKTRIRAIAVMAGLLDSAVVTLEYEIALPSTSGGGSTGGTSSGSSSSSSGNKTETVTHPDGSTTTTVTKADGSTTQTTKHPDGSQSVVETKKDGTTTTTATDAAGNKTETVKTPAGETTTTVYNKDGAGSVTVTKADGHTSGKVTLTSQSTADAAQKGGMVALPMPAVSATADRASAPVVTVNLPDSSTVKVEIPVKDVTMGTVAVLIKSDGTEQVMMQTQLTENGIAVKIKDGDTVRIVDNTKRYTDVPASYWGAAAVDYVTGREIFSGTGAATFAPEEAMDRAMIVTVLARLDGVDTSVGANWYDAGRQWAMQKGVSDGSDMQASLTREQLAAMLYRYAGSPSANGALDAYSDGTQVSAYARQAMAWAVQEGLLTGTTSTTLEPQEQATRAQVAVILQRFIQSMA